MKTSLDISSSFNDFETFKNVYVNCHPSYAYDQKAKFNWAAKDTNASIDVLISIFH